MACIDTIDLFRNLIRPLKPPFSQPFDPLPRRLLNRVCLAAVDRKTKKIIDFFGQSRFRKKSNSFCYPQSGFAVIDGRLKLSKIGDIRISMHRPIQGEIKTCTLRKTAPGDWNVSFSCEMEVEPKAPKEESVGIDVGLTHFAVFSSGETIKNPAFFKQAEKDLAKAQRQLAKLEKGTK